MVPFRLDCAGGSGDSGLTSRVGVIELEQPDTHRMWLDHLNKWYRSGWRCRFASIGQIHLTAADGPIWLVAHTSPARMHQAAAAVREEKLSLR
jgi:hypothetical protein